MRACILALVLSLLVQAQAAAAPDSLTVSPAEFECLALNDYFEARGESTAGRLAVAHVVLNRVMDTRFPEDICSVVKQNRTRHAHRCQFSWYCDNRSDTPYNKAAWHRSRKLATAILQKDSALVDPTNGSLWYHASFVSPRWSANLRVSLVLGGHVFYRDGLEKTARRDRAVPDLHRFEAWDVSRRKNTLLVLGLEYKY